MADTNNIFKKLKDFEISPPGGLFARIWHRIKNAAGREKFVPEDNDQQSKNYKRIFTSLQSYTDKGNAIPPFDFKAITENIAEKNLLPQKNVHKIRNLVIAAAAIITGSGIFIYQQYISATPGADLQTENAIANLKKDSLRAAMLKRAADSATKKMHSHDIAYTIAGELKSNENSTAPITTPLYNDFIYTYTGFSYDEKTRFLDALKKSKRISIDEFSYVNISDEMALFLTKMYDVNRRNKPTWKARRLNKKLNKWKKKDQVYFDKDFQHNPMDIIDLSEFILKN